MEKLLVLGTGNAMVTQCYNTCFLLQSASGNVMVDAGGGNGILRQMQRAGVRWETVKHLIVTHEHCDHLLGVVWVIRKIGTLMLQNAYPGQFTIWCHARLETIIGTLARLTLQEKIWRLIGDRKNTWLGDYILRH